MYIRSHSNYTFFCLQVAMILMVLTCSVLEETVIPVRSALTTAVYDLTIVLTRLAVLLQADGQVNCQQIDSVSQTPRMSMTLLETDLIIHEGRVIVTQVLI